MDQHCWEIIQCDKQSTCPARSNVNKHCWEVMGEQNSFQCHYGLCEECIVYLVKSQNSLFSSKQLEKVMLNRLAVHQDC